METQVTLRDWKIEDSVIIPKLANNKNIWDEVRDEFPFPYRESDAINFINKVKENKSTFSKAIEYKNSLVGSITIKVNDDILRFSGVLGYWISPDYWNKGIATDAIKQITELGFSQLKLVRIYAKVFSTNQASIKALEKSGYIKEGLFSKAVFKNGQFYDQVLYAKISG